MNITVFSNESLMPIASEAFEAFEGLRKHGKTDATIFNWSATWTESAKRVEIIALAGVRQYTKSATEEPQQAQK